VALGFGGASKHVSEFERLAGGGRHFLPASLFASVGGRFGLMVGEVDGVVSGEVVFAAIGAFFDIVLADGGEEVRRLVGGGGVIFPSFGMCFAWEFGGFWLGAGRHFGRGVLSPRGYQAMMPAGPYFPKTTKWEKKMCSFVRSKTLQEG